LHEPSATGASAADAARTVILSAAKDLASTFEARCFAALNMTVSGAPRGSFFVQIVLTL
jgi:hypothetical protein